MSYENNKRWTDREEEILKWRERRKQAFIEWLEDMYSNDPNVDEYVEMFIGRVIDKAKEML